MKMEKVTSEQVALRAYCAGIIDGEGYLGLNRLAPTAANKKTTPKYRIRLSIAMADRDPLAAVASLIGCEGKIYLRDRKQKAHHVRMFILDLESHTAIALIKLVQPYLLVKKKQSEVLCKFYEFSKTSREHRTKRGAVRYFKAGPQVGKAYRVKQQSDYYVARCDEFYLALRRRDVTNNGIGLMPW